MNGLMEKGRDSQAEIQALLTAWPALAPDPKEMERVAQRMVAMMAAAPVEATAEPHEAQFRLLTILCGAIVLVAYLAWPLLRNWFSLHPTLTVVLAVVGGLSLLAPLLLLAAPKHEPHPAVSLGSKGGTLSW